VRLTGEEEGLRAVTAGQSEKDTFCENYPAFLEKFSGLPLVPVFALSEGVLKREKLSRAQKLISPNTLAAYCAGKSGKNKV